MGEEEGGGGRKMPISEDGLGEISMIIALRFLSFPRTLFISNMVSDSSRPKSGYILKIILLAVLSRKQNI